MPQDDEEYGLFGRPLFNDPAARALARVGVVDVGSNSVRLVVFDGAARSPAYFYNEKIMCGLGAGLRDSGRLNPEGRARALSALRRFAVLAESMGAAPLTCAATAAVRDAEDGPEFRDEVRAATGLTLHVIPGEEEARLSAQGVLLGWPGAHGMLCDIGGSSMELADLENGNVGARVTSDLGPLKLRGMAGGKRAIKVHIRKVIDGLFEHMGRREGQRIFLVGGSWRAFAKVDMERQAYPLHVLHEYRMTRRDIARTGRLIEQQGMDDLRLTCGISSTRADLLPLASFVLRALVRRFKPRDICVSSYGIREGMLYEQMPQKLRDRDPLIEACRFAEAKDARMPGFGRTLYHFVMPLFGRSTYDRKRLIRAACLLHDVSWRAHPDYRAEACFEYATRANLGGLRHSERIMLGLALMNRYSSKPPEPRFAALQALLSPDQQHFAIVLGRAMRLGAMLWMEPGAQPAELRWRPKKRVLGLHLSAGSEPIFGEVAEARFNALAQVLAAEPDIRHVRGA